ncbi:family 10 glycosylhydrolase [Caldithrix abyssi]
MKQTFSFFVFILLFSFNLFAKNNEEFRALWVVTWEYINPELSASQNKAKIRQILDNVQKANMNAVLWQVRQSGTAYYPSSYEPWGYYANYHNDPGFDPLNYALQEAHKRGLEFHAWFNVFHVASTWPGTPAAEHPEWICTNEDGQFMTAHRCVSPGLDEVRAYTIQVAMEIVRNYDIDGLHLDFVRWNEYTEDDMATAPSLLEQVRTLDGMIPQERINKLEKTSGTKRYIYDVEHPASGGVPAGFDTWGDWRRWGVTEFVRQLHDSIQAVKPWVRLSPAALGKYNWSGWNGYYVVFQDAALWFNEGYIDQLTPMHYHWLTGSGFYDMLTGACPDCWSQWIPKGIQDGRLYTVGPGSYMLDENNVWDNHQEIVERSRQVQWTDGFQFFSYASWQNRDYWNEAAKTFFKNKTRIRATGLIVNSRPAAPTLNLTKLDSMNYQIDIAPPDTISKNYWFAIYRSLDSTLDVNNDPIIHLHFGKDSFSYIDAYANQPYQPGRYIYFATMLDRYWNESDISNAATGDSIPLYITAPDQTPGHIIVLGLDANSLLIKCDPVERADRYVAYISLDGINVIDSAEASSNEILVDGLTEGETYYFKVKAANAAGSTSLSKHLYAGIPSASPHQVLVVNGFDRGTNIRYDYIKYYAGPLARRGYAFSYALTESVIDGKIALSDYPIVIWILGDESTADETFSSTEQDSVKNFLKRGGYLFVSGSEIGWDLDYKGSATDQSFYHNYLKAQYVADAPDGKKATFYTCQPVPGGLFDGLVEFNFDNGTHGTIDVDWPDAIKPINGAAAILKYKGASTANIAGIVFEGTFPGGSAEGKLVNLGVPFETIYYADKRDSLLNKIFDFFEGKITAVPSEHLSPLAFTLEQNFPNPFNPSTTIRYSLKEAAPVTLEIFNTLGQRVRLLVQAKQTRGAYQVQWDGTNEAGKAVPSGVYIYRLKAKDFTASKRMLLIR